MSINLLISIEIKDLNVYNIFEKGMEMLVLGISVSKDIFPAELIVSLAVMLIIAIFSFIVYFKAKKWDPLKKPKGIMLIAEMYVNMIDNLVKDNMGSQFKVIGGAIFGFICPYLFLSMIAGLFGVPSPTTFLYVPLSLGLITFIMIHATSVHYTRIKYFKRYVEPLPFFLPINLLSMWAPLLSLTFRLFGNAVAGYVIMRLIYWAFEEITIGVVSLAPAAALITPVLHAYFDVFSGFIQTTVFTLLSMALIKNEVPEDVQNKYEKQAKLESTKK